MAKKGQKFNKYNKEFRIEIFQELKNKSVNQVSKEFNINSNTIHSWKRSFKNNTLNTNKGEIRDLKYYKERYEILKKYQNFLSQERKKR